MNTPDAASRLQSAAARAWIARLSALLPAAEAEEALTRLRARFPSVARVGEVLAHAGGPRVQFLA